VGWWSNLTSSPAQTFVAAADYSSGFLGQLVGGSSDSPGTAGFTNDFFQGVAASSPSGFWAVGWDDFATGGETLTELIWPQLTLAGPASTNESSSFSLTVTAADPGCSPITTYTGKVHFSSSDSQAVLPHDYRFVGGDLGTKMFSGVALHSAGVQTITVTDTLVSDSGSIAITVHCIGTCQAPPAPPGGRGVATAPASTPGPRTPKGSGLRLGQEAPGVAQHQSTSQAAANAVRPAAHLKSGPARATRHSSAAPAISGKNTTATSSAGHRAMSLAAQTGPLAPPPDQAPWWLLLLAITLLAVAVAMVVMVRRAAEEDAPF
jgi:hypothetical protein